VVYITKPLSERVNAELLAAVEAKISAAPSLGPAQAFDAVIAAEGERFPNAKQQRQMILNQVYLRKRLATAQPVPGQVLLPIEYSMALQPSTSGTPSIADPAELLSRLEVGEHLEAVGGQLALMDAGTLAKVCTNFT
jgi:hypothetical protein